MKVKSMFTLMMVLLMAVCPAFAAQSDKTLLAWVRLADPTVRAGSVLTVQDGPEFDGIVFAEKEAGKWMAGSDFFRRTQKSLKESRRETADDKTMVKMAVVYRGKQITIYRNGKKYASYQAEPIDLLGRKNPHVVFGLRHLGGSGSIDGAIEDARIYRRALTAEELAELQPDQKSGPDPYAWWNFEEGGGSEQMGAFPHQRLSGGARISDGKLLLGPGAFLVAAKSEEAVRAARDTRPGSIPYLPETPVWPKDPPDHWPIYHLAHPGFTMGSPFDPNPALFYQGRYHLHYIYRNRSGFVFAHVSSPDMVHWKWHPTVLAPPTTGHGMFSGTGFFTKEGKPALVYHGQGSNRHWILYGLDDELNSWSEPRVMLPHDGNGRLMDDISYFDPDIWLNGGTYYGLNGVSSKKPPRLMKSNDLKEWMDLGEFLHPDFDEEKLGVPKSEDISCPNVFKLGDKWVLLCISHRLGCRYFIGDFKDEKFLPESHALLGGNSSRYFAPESLLTPDGRRVIWTWFRGGEVKGVQSLPTEFELTDDGALEMKPIRELENLRSDKQELQNLALGKGATVPLETIAGDHLELKLEVKDPGEVSFGVNVLCDDEGDGGLRILIDQERNLLSAGREKAPFSLAKGEPLSLRVFVDGTLVEVFANDRQLVMTDHPRAQGEPFHDGITLFTSNGSLTVDSIKAWKMRSAYHRNDVDGERPGAER